MERKHVAWLVGLGFVLGLGWGAPVVAQDKDKDEDRIEEEVPGHKDMVKVTHIFRHKKGKGASTLCLCGGPEGVRYSLEKVKWFEPSIRYTIYTMNSGIGAAAGDAVKASFSAWKASNPNAPLAVATIVSTAPAPGIALDNEQAVFWQPLSATYGANTLAVTSYWYSRAKTGGFSKIIHFDMAYNTDYSWAVLDRAGSCAGADATAFDVQNIGTHEAGHVYGLNHNADCNLTMNPTAGAGETIKSTLAPGDVNGIKAIY